MKWGEFTELVESQGVGRDTVLYRVNWKPGYRLRVFPLKLEKHPFSEATIGPRRMRTRKVRKDCPGQTKFIDV